MKLSFVCFEISRERSKKSAVRTHFHFDFRNMETWLQNKTLKKLPIQSITEKRIKIGNQEVMNKKKVSNSIRQQKLSILLLTE